ncbi:MAG: hypothetical protein ABH827_01155 [bacterium]
MKHLFGKVLLSCGLVLVIGSYSFGDCFCAQDQVESTRKFNKAKFFSSLAKVLDKVGQAAVSSPKTKEEDQIQKIEAVAAVLDFVGVVSGDQQEPVNTGEKDTGQKKQTRSCDMIISSDLLETVFCALRVSLEANIDVVADLVRSSLNIAQTVQNNVFLTRGVVDSMVTVQNSSKDSTKDSTKVIVALVTVIWKLIQEIMTQENISEYLSNQVTEIINYVYGHLVADITQDAQAVVDQMPADSAVAMQGAFVGNIVASFVAVNSEK